MYYFFLQSRCTKMQLVESLDINKLIFCVHILFQELLQKKNKLYFSDLYILHY